MKTVTLINEYAGLKPKQQREYRCIGHGADYFTIRARGAALDVPWWCVCRYKPRSEEEWAAAMRSTDIGISDTGLRYNVKIPEEV